MFTLTIDASELLAALILTIPCASTDTTRPHMACVALITYLGEKTARTDVVSTDGHRLSLWQSKPCTRKKNADAAIGSFFDETDTLVTTIPILIPRESAIKIQKAIVAYKRDSSSYFTDLTVTFVLESPKLVRATIGLDVISISIDDAADQFLPYETVIPTARMSSDSGGFCLSGEYLSDFADSLLRASKTYCKKSRDIGLLIFHGDCVDPVVFRSNIPELSNWFGIIMPIRYFDNKPSSAETIRHQTPKYKGIEESK